MKNNLNILVINPGSTSTKVALFKGEKNHKSFEFSHDTELFQKYSSILQQLEYRFELIIKFVKENIDPEEIDAVIGRGGLLKPLRGGVYKINETMLGDLSTARHGEHACNLGAILAFKFSKMHKIPAFISDPVTVDELAPEARITGSALFKKVSVFHALNQKSIAKSFSENIGKSYEKINLIVVHIGGGISVGVHKKGRVIDVNNALEEGPFTPERSGSLPTAQLVKLCYSGKYSEKEMSKILVGKGGLVSHLGTSDCRIIEKRILKGDKKAKLIYKAMGYSIAKYIGAASTVLNGKLEAIILTGGGAKSRLLVHHIKERVKFIAPVKIYAGENELGSLASGALRALEGKERILTYK